VAQVALQQGRYAGRLIRGPTCRKAGARPFRYFDKGNMAVVGKGFAVLESGNGVIAGVLAMAGGLRDLEFLGQSAFA